ncbi:hypothetical protein FDECE_2133 [Fusarium decemcellulare]|nr:hypothetical protein FDECE_2133 [Fusarium decemcellulare]
MLFWTSLPAEIRLIILEQLTQHGHIASYATVSKEWQAVVEKKTFRQLKLTQSCLDDFEEVVQWRRGLVKHVCLNIELRTYTCLHCQREESPHWSFLNSCNRIALEAVSKLFSILSTWKRTKRDELALELNAYTPSDWHQRFKTCYFGALVEDDLEYAHQPPHDPTGIHDPVHGWGNGHQFDFPPDDAIRRLYADISLQFKKDLPRVRAATKFLLPRQCRRQWSAETLWSLWAKLPRLKEIIYEPWQSYDKNTQYFLWDRGYRQLAIAHVPRSVRKLSVFEDFDEEYLALFQLGRPGVPWSTHLNPGPVRLANPTVGTAFAIRSVMLKEPSVSFMVDAQHFFYACQPQWRWIKLRSLTLTSRLMTPASSRSEIANLLRAAGQAALCMPKLQTMTLWNGAKGEACAFTFRMADASLTWRGAWELKMDHSVLEAWKNVAYTYARYELRVETQLLSCAIGPHGDAIHHLDLHSVIDPVSLWQIRMENP